jgi:hypothetical protein
MSVAVPLLFLHAFMVWQGKSWLNSLSSLFIGGAGSEVQGGGCVCNTSEFWHNLLFMFNNFLNKKYKNKTKFRFTVLQFYKPTVLQFYSFTVLQFYNSTVLQF